MTNTNLLKEAIADAKAVKETAIANAKLALEEAFTPHLKSMLSAKLQEMDDDIDEGEKEEMQEMDDVSWKEKNGDSLDLAPRKVGQSTVNEEEDMDEDLDLNELLSELELDEDARTDAEEEGYLDGEEDEKEDMEGEMDDEEIDLEDMSEDDLKGFIESVIKDMVAAGEIEPGDEFAEDDMEVGDIEGEEAGDDLDVDVEIAEMSNPVMRDGDKGDDQAEKDTEKMRFKEGVGGSGEVDVDNNIAVKAINDAAEKIAKLTGKSIDMVKAKLKGLMSEEEAKKMEFKEAVGGSGEIDVENNAAVKAINDAAEKIAQLTGKSIDMVKAKLKGLMSEEEEAELAEIEELKKELNEVNLLNAKLLYTNKIFRAKNLTESKKVTVLKAFDNAKDVKQAKTIYETLSAGLMDKNVNESVKRGLASQATGLEPKAVQQPIVESNDIYNRMRQLAGLL
jgi:hypothetical protein